MKNSSLVVLILLLTFAAAVSANAAASEKAIAKALELWEPLSISLRDNHVTVVTKERRVTETIYLAMVMGICMSTVTMPGTLDGVSEVSFLNRFSGQGYVFEGREKDCEEYVKLKKTKMWVLGRTHLY